MAGPRHAHAPRRAAVAAAFFGQGLVFISLTTRLPEMQRKLDLSPGDMSILLLGLVLTSGVGSLLGELIAPRRGSALALRAGFGLMAVVLPLLAMGHNMLTAGLAMAAYGLAIGLVDAGSNMQGVAVEHEYGRPIMPTFHGAWTLGGVLGTLGALATHALSFETAAFGLAAIPLLLVFAKYLHAPQPIVAIGEGKGSDKKSVSWRRILLVGAAMVLFYMADTAVTAWGPTYLDTQFTAPSAMVAVATLPYLIASLVGRGAGDHLAHRFGAVPLVSAAAGLGAIGLATVVFSPSGAIAMVGFTIMGLGISVIAPLSYSAAASIARESVIHDDLLVVRARIDAIIARFNQFNYVGALLGAVMTGAVGNDNLRLGFAVPMVLVLAILPLARAFRA